MESTTARRHFPGVLPEHKALDPKSETYAHEKWQRAHEKKRLAAYLKGRDLFSHGRTMTVTGWAPVRWYVTPRP